ncbi:hypothetical protein [Sulfitobacter sp. SK011]|uniref:hypothetical protein n=1 Tax=Sulfitobacter sp. SK011 TaxID=1389004 RepID=UPI000E0A7DC5|nr:hypothetical protein [Sulfitobacter sp. SK011]AXI40796.1 hypothetical protein C1J02_01615 [Sulfitobacter sp. SK011]
MITKIVLTGFAVVIGWLAVLAGVMLVSDAAPAALVMFPDPTFLNDLPQGVAILSQNAVSVTLISEMSGFGAALYRAGAIVVLPAGLLGCVPLTS